MFGGKSAFVQGTSAILMLCEKFRDLNNRRSELDDRVTAATNASRDEHWLELEAALADINELIARVAEAQAADIAELRAKAEVLASLLKSNTSNDGFATEQNLTSKLALSLANDIAVLPLSS